MTALAQHVFKIIGPFRSWELIGCMSPAIPAMRAIKDHVEETINKFRRGKSHTAPSAEKDIDMYAAALGRNSAHVLPVDGPRTLPAAAKSADHLAKGLDTLLKQKALKRWAESRVYQRSHEQDWTTIFGDDNT